MSSSFYFIYVQWVYLMRNFHFDRVSSYINNFDFSFFNEISCKVVFFCLKLLDCFNFMFSLYYYISIYANSRMLNGNELFRFSVEGFSENSRNIIISYLNKYPLKSSKRLNYLVWRIIHNNRKFPLTREQMTCYEKIRENYNSRRTVFYWSHLNKWEL